MINARQIHEEIDRLDTLGGMMEAYQEIATNRMQRIRDSVIRNRSFLTALDTVYFQVKASYKRELAKLKKHSSLTDKNGKTAILLVSANTGLYGDIVAKTYALFKKDLQTHACDVFIVGKLGKALFEEDNPNISYTYIELSDSQFADEELKVIAEKLHTYSAVLIYHGLFHTILAQVPVSSNLTQTSDETLLSNEPNIKFFFEPSLVSVMDYFEKQIFSSNLTHSMHESQLAKLASRTITLENSRNNIRDAQKAVLFQKQVILHRISNKKQINTLTGMSLWNTT